MLTLPGQYSTRVIFVAMILMLTGYATFAQNSVWNGGSGNWTDNNWTPAAPTSTSNVFIDNGNPVASTVLLNIASATVNNLTLDPGNTLTLEPIATLTVNGTATLNGITNVGLGTLTLNGASTNSAEINLATETVVINGHTFLLGEGNINGAGSLTNTQLIQGSGNISVALVNSGNVVATDASNPLSLSGNVNNAGGDLAGISGTLLLNGSTVTGGTLDGNLTGRNGATLTNVALGSSTGVSVTDGSTLSVQGTVTVTNNGPLKLGNGVTLTGPGTLVNDTAPFLEAGGILAVSGQATLQVNVTQLPGSFGLVGEGGTLVLDGSTVSGGFVLGALAGKNGATLNNLQIGIPQGGSASFANGSTFAIQGTVTNIADGIALGNGVTLTGPGTLVNSGPYEAAVAVTNGQAILQVNVTQFDSNILWGQGSGTIVLDGSTVTGGSILGNFVAKNGATLDNVQIAPDIIPATVSLADGSTLGIKNTVTNSGTLALGTGGTGATLNSVLSLGFVNGLPTLVSGTLVNDGTIHGGGTLAVNIANSGSIVADNASTPLVLAGNVTDPKGLSVFRATNGGTLTINSASASGQIVDIQTGGKLNGIGTINVNDNVGNGGIVTPGLNAPGTLTINGIYSQAHNGTTNGVLDFLLGGGQAGRYSQLDVNGFALFDNGSVIEASFFNGFDPSGACANVTGVCEMFDVLHLTDGMIETVVANPITMTTTDILGIAGLDFELPTLANGLTWSEVDLNNQDLELEIISSGEGPGGGGGGTNVPEPSSLPLLGIGMVGLAILRAWRRRVGSLA